MSWREVLLILGVLNDSILVRLPYQLRARGGIVNEQDLAEAVRRGKVAGVDTYAEEPIHNNPFEGLARVVQTPHLGASTTEGQVRAGVQLVEQIIAELKRQETRKDTPCCKCFRSKASSFLEKGR